MSSFVLNRRAMLSGVTLFGASALLAACGQQANNEAAATTPAAPRSPLKGVQAGALCSPAC